MAKLDMTGPFVLTKEEIEKQIPEKVIGNYAFGYIDPSDNKFVIEYVGRADGQPLRERIKHGIADGYKEFMFSIAANAKEAYEKECKNWHEFGGPKGWLDNKIHPDKPNNTDYECPYCDDMEQKRQLKLERPRFRR